VPPQPEQMPSDSKDQQINELMQTVKKLQLALESNTKEKETPAKRNVQTPDGYYSNTTGQNAYNGV